MKIIGIVLLITICFACTKPVSIDPCEEIQNSKIETIWTVLMSENGSFPQIKRDLIIAEDQLIVTYSNYSKGTIKSYEITDSGRLNWVWNKLSSYSTYTDYDHVTGYLVHKSGLSRVSINIEDGSTIETARAGKGRNQSGNGVKIGSYLYYVETPGSYFTYGSWLLRSPISNLSIVDTLYYLNDEMDGGLGSNVNLWIHPQSGDSIFIFQHLKYWPYRLSLFAWNMRDNEVLWKHDDLLNSEKSNSPLIVNDKLYFAGGTALYCFDMFNGIIEWQYDHNFGGTASESYKIAYAETENKIIVKDTADKLFGFNTLTGALDWVKSDAGVSSPWSGPPVYHQGILYYTMQGLLWAVRASDGEILWSERPDKPPCKATFNGNVAIDPERRLLYVTDETRLFAIKLYGE